MAYIALNPKSYETKVVGNGDCVAFVKVSANAPQTSLWKPGVNVKGATLQEGTAIATFQKEEYTNRRNGDSHAAIYIGQDKVGLYVWDQWKGHPVSARRIRFKEGVGAACDDGDAFYVIEMK